MLGNFGVVFVLKHHVVVAVNAFIRQADDSAVAACGIVSGSKGIRLSFLPTWPRPVQRADCRRYNRRSRRQ